MVINNLNLICITILPDKANPPLIVDPDTVLPLAVMFQLLQSVSRRYSQFIDNRYRIQDQKFSGSPPPNVIRKPPRALALKQPFRIRVCKRLDHWSI